MLALAMSFRISLMTVTEEEILRWTPLPDSAVTNKIMRDKVNF
jgi:hypothetical protein